ncbi:MULTISPECIES: hypothetical protein [unclassified Caballeronia]|uniref:hypothetical protein n=1 Tax=unclassified Caballeronia TaxID=2646786 RepID=UPI00285A352A|nr:MULTISPECIES: hypothetical protein [unclassified Caballeronia]MDR5772097.1 hypothetical protein [Caballeronia sp. LZ002]MDR5847531.1 hypothetical protein [Caballeronia sp. LZ003]
MSLEAALTENTAVMRELIAALTAAGALQTAQASAQAASSPAVKAVVKAQKELQDNTAKKSTAENRQAAAEPTDSPSGEQLTPAQANESAPAGDAEPGSLPWAEKTAELYAKLKDLDPNFANMKDAVLGINRLVGREQAEAVLGRFGAQAITAKADKKGLDEKQYPAVYQMCLGVLAGHIDATASME